MATSLHIVVKTKDDGKTYVLDCIKTSKNKAIIRQTELIKEGYKVRIDGVIPNEEGVDVELNTLNYMSYDPSVVDKS